MDRASSPRLSSCHHVRALALIAVPLALAAGCRDDDAPQPSACAAQIGPEGGVLECEQDHFRVIVPPGALSEPVEITVEATPAHDGSVGPVYEVGPSGTVFAEPVRMELELGDAALEHDRWLALATTQDGVWRTLGEPNLDEQTGVLSGQTWHLSPFAAQPGARIDMLSYVIPHNLCEEGRDRSLFRQGRGIIAAAAHSQAANGDAFFYLVKNRGNHNEIRGFEEWSVDGEGIYILSDYTWAGGEGEFVCTPDAGDAGDAEDGGLEQVQPGRGVCMDDPSQCNNTHDFAWTRYYRDGGNTGASWLPRYLAPQQSQDDCEHGGDACIREFMSSIRYVGMTMAELWPWLDPASALPRCETECVSNVTSPPAGPQSRDLEMVLYGPGHTPCTQLPEDLQGTCDTLAARSGSLPAVILAYVRDGFGRHERYWYGYGDGWIAYQREHDAGIERRDDDEWVEHPEWVLPSFDCREGASRTGTDGGYLCGLIGQAPPEPVPDPVEPDPNPEPEPDPEDPYACTAPASCDVGHPVWTCADDEHVQRVVEGVCEQQCCGGCAPGEPGCEPSACVSAPVGDEDGCRSDADLDCDPSANDGMLSAALPGAVYPDGLTLNWPFEDGTDVGVLQAYGRWSWALHRGVVRDTRSNDEYALDLQPQVQGGGMGAAVLSVDAGVVHHIEDPTDESLAAWQDQGWPSFTGLGRRVIVAHCGPGQACPGIDDSNVVAFSLYAHLDEIAVESGAMVVSGQRLGAMGSTGATGGTPHLHFAMYARDAQCTGCTNAVLGGSVTRSIVAGQAMIPEPMGEDSCLRRGQAYTVPDRCPERQTFNIATGTCRCDEGEGFFEVGGASCGSGGSGGPSKSQGPAPLQCQGCDDIDPDDPFWNDVVLQCQPCPFGALDVGVGTGCQCDTTAGFVDVTGPDGELACACAADTPYFDANTGTCGSEPVALTLQYRWFSGDGVDLDTETTLLSPGEGESLGFCDQGNNIHLGGWSDVTSNGGTEVVTVDLAGALMETDQVRLESSAWWWGSRCDGGVEMIVSDGLTTLTRAVDVVPVHSSCDESNEQVLGTVVFDGPTGTLMFE